MSASGDFVDPYTGIVAPVIARVIAVVPSVRASIVAGILNPVAEETIVVHMTVAAVFVEIQTVFAVV